MSFSVKSAQTKLCREQLFTEMSLIDSFKIIFPFRWYRWVTAEVSAQLPVTWVVTGNRKTGDERVIKRTDAIHPNDYQWM